MAMAPRPEVRVFIGLGGNLDQPVARIRSARQAIGALAGVAEVGFSKLYRSTPMGPAGQPDYVNAVMAIDTVLDAEALLDRLQAIETDHGRVRIGERWGPRTLDLDILLFGDQTIATDRLTVPHRGLAEREFVLYPLHEIAPQLTIPGAGVLGELVAACPLRGLSVIADD